MRRTIERTAVVLAVAIECVVIRCAGGDVVSAAGMRVVAITTTNPRATLQSAGADCIIDSFTELCGAELTNEKLSQ